MPFYVLAERCDQCLYSKRKIVSNERRADIIREVERKDTNFICHKASMLGLEVCCRGDFDQRGGGQMARIAGRLGALEFVDEAKLPELAAQKRPRRQRLHPEVQSLKQAIEATAKRARAGRRSRAKEKPCK